MEGIIIQNESTSITDPVWRVSSSTVVNGKIKDLGHTDVTQFTWNTDSEYMIQSLSRKIKGNQWLTGNYQIKGALVLGRMKT